MSIARLKRLAKLESRRPTADYWRDPYTVAIAISAALAADQAAERAGREFCPVPSPNPTPASDALAHARPLGS